MSEVMGKIEKLPFKEGDLVKQGDIVAVINGKDLASDVNRMEASLKIAKIQVRHQEMEVQKAKNLFNRKKKLFEKKLISLEDFELSEIALKEAKLTLENYLENVKQSKAQLDKAKELMAKTVIKAPIDGKITALYKEVGEQVIQGTINVQGSVIMEISDMSGIELEVEINEVESSRIKTGMSSTITLDAIQDKTFKGEVSEIGQSAYKPAGKDVSVLKVKISLKETDNAMKPGLSGQADIIVLEKNKVLTIPIEAVKKEKKENNNDNKKENKQYCFKFENNKAKKTYIKTGYSNDTHLEVLSGLKEGDLVITGPYRVLKKLKDNDTVKRKKEDK
jgi:HlyD family secretion protein